MKTPIVQLFEILQARTAGIAFPYATKAAPLAELILAGLCLRHHIPLSAITGAIPGINETWILSQISQIMLDASASQWYFAKLDRFDGFFALSLGEAMPFPHEATAADRAASHGKKVNSGRAKIPSMPVSPHLPTRELNLQYGRKQQSRLKPLPALAI